MPKSETPRFRPLADRVLVHVDEAERVTPGGIHLPDKAQERPHRGTVLAVGPGKFCPEITAAEPIEKSYSPMSVKPGDVVYFNQWAGVEVPKELGEGLRVMGLDDLLGVEE